MKKVMLGVFALFLFSFGTALVKAARGCQELEKRSFTFCESGCDYSNVNNLIADNTYSNGCDYYTITVNIEDNGYYDFSAISTSYNRYYFVGKGEQKPSIYVGDGDTSVIGLKDLIVSGNMLYTTENIEINNIDVEEDMTFSSDEGIKIINSTLSKSVSFTSKDEIIFDNIHTKDFASFQGVTYIDNSTFDKSLSVIGYGHIKDSTINANGVYGIFLRPEIPRICYTESVNDVQSISAFSIDNVKVHGASDYGIIYEVASSFYPSLDIKNSDLTQNGCSFVAEVVEPSSVCVATNFSSSFVGGRNPIRFLRIDNNNYNVLFQNTKLNCACSQGMEGSELKPVIYVPANNTWTNRIIRTTLDTDIEANKANVLESNGAKVLIDFANKDEIMIDDKNTENINSYFSELDGVDSSSINWRVVDNRILRIDNGQIIPLMIGETDVVGTYLNNDYTLHIKVKSLGVMQEVSKHVVNPDTNDQLIIVALLFFASIIFYLIGLITKKKIKRIEF